MQVIARVLFLFSICLLQRF